MDFGDGEPIETLDFEVAKNIMDKEVHDLQYNLQADRILITISSPINFRYKVASFYKHNRATTEEPEMRQQCKDYLTASYPSLIIPGLEADDVMGIVATSPNNINKYGTEKVIVSEDKDMRTIPGLVYHPHRPSQGIMEITPIEATRFLLYQTLVGDPTDGYKGAPRVGPKHISVAALYDTDDVLDMWDIVVSCFQSKGLTEGDAIQQATLARILRWEDFQDGPGNWSPTALFY